MDLGGKVFIGLILKILMCIDWIGEPFGLLEVFSMCSHGDGGEIVLYDLGLSFLVDEVVSSRKDKSILVGGVLE